VNREHASILTVGECLLRNGWLEGTAAGAGPEVVVGSCPLRCRRRDSWNLAAASRCSWLGRASTPGLPSPTSSLFVYASARNSCRDMDCNSAVCDSLVRASRRAIAHLHQVFIAVRKRCHHRLV